MEDDRIERYDVVSVDKIFFEDVPPYAVRLWLNVRDKPTIELRIEPAAMSELERKLLELAMAQKEALQKDRPQ